MLLATSLVLAKDSNDEFCFSEEGGQTCNRVDYFLNVDIMTGCIICCFKLLNNQTKNELVLAISVVLMQAR